MLQLIMCKGLPASGKSTWAKKMVLDNPGKYKRTNKDELRETVDGGRFSKSNESFILRLRDSIVSEALFAGINVIVDDTNLDPKHAERLKDLALVHKAEFVIQDFTDVPVFECIERDRTREKKVGRQVIMQMYERYLKPEPARYDVDLPRCIICDIDGTLAEKGDRDIYDYSKVDRDILIVPVWNILNMVREYNKGRVKIFIFSGREDSCQEETTNRLQEHDVLYDSLHMRKTGDNRDDTIVKRELYEEHIKGKYNVDFVIDDRLKVLEMRVAQGLFTLNVNQLNIRF